MRLHAKFWVDAHIRQNYLEDRPCYLVHKGDAERGGVVLKIDRFDNGISLYEAATSFEGDRVWRQLGDEGMSSQDASERITKKRNFDPDIWVLEIEDRVCSYELDAPVEQL